MGGLENVQKNSNGRGWNKWGLENIAHEYCEGQLRTTD